MRRIIAIVALSTTPAALPAQRVANARAGVTPAPMKFTLPTRADTTNRDSVAQAYTHSHGRHVIIGAASGLVGGLVVGGAAASYAESQCAPNDDMCGLNGLLVPFYALIGLLVGTITGALWPMH